MVGRPRDIEAIKIRYSGEALDALMRMWEEKLIEMGKTIKLLTSPSNLSYTQLAELVHDNIITSCHGLVIERTSKDIVGQDVFEKAAKEQKVQSPGDQYILLTLLAHQKYNDMSEQKDAMEGWIREEYAPALALCTAENMRALEEATFDATQFLQLPEKSPRVPKTILTGKPSGRELINPALMFSIGLSNAVMRLHTQERTPARFLTGGFSTIGNWIRKLTYGRIEEKDRALVELIEHSPTQAYTCLVKQLYSGTANRDLTTFLKNFINMGHLVDGSISSSLMSFHRKFEDFLRETENYLDTERQELQEKERAEEHAQKHTAKKAAAAALREKLDEQLATAPEFFSATVPSGMQSTVTQFAELLHQQKRVANLDNQMLATKYQSNGGDLAPKEVETMLSQLNGIEDRFRSKDKSTKKDRTSDEKQDLLKKVPTPSLNDVNTFADVLFANRPGRDRYDQYAALAVDILQTTKILNRANSEAAKEIGRHLLQSSVSVVLRDATGIKAFGDAQEDVEKKTKHLNTIKENRPNLQAALKADPKLATQLAENSIGLLLTTALEGPQEVKILIKQLSSRNAKEGAARELVEKVVGPEGRNL